MITLHHLEHSRSQRIIWLLEELGLEYQIQHYARDADTHLAPAALLAVHPLGKAPVITDGDNVVAESGAIIEYLVDRHGGNAGLRPAAGTPEALRWTYWLHFAEGSMMPPLLVQFIFRRVRKADMPFFARPIAERIADSVESAFVQPNLGRQLDFMESELASRDWFAGDAFTAADIQLSFPLEAAAAREWLNPEKHPRLLGWLARIQARPAYLRARERGGPYEL
ncbi:glutathione S-transferase [Bordetella sp. J329]|jgi:glutathione S-transferase|uniref:glutathione S-transferase n=1 Tax=Kerstersia gyiorum TaxID=206506 RepID=UPI000FDA3961|nr:glutathione S-transferase [Kerstersia gyiorum]AZV94097.1 glutathione S-transferase [Bordetella sp. J329]MCH4271483.1 glutathione S-transferase [Kerstersia gyiorum]MCI1229672.1 glutathione S-transferase [Kerstersia gyiorum]